MLTAAEWLSENSERQELAVMNIPLAMELYAKYRETELSRPPKDVVEAIEKKYPLPDNPDLAATWIFNDHMRTAALHGYSLASGEAVEFAEWVMNNNYLPDVIGMTRWLSDFDAPNGVEPFTTAQLFELFKKERNG